ncbi:MAG: DUF348 domain-containing protein [Ruminococcaceae bacterium]|nr:DUF348 domain-containing protein [Oscillospiraceae bacterium]
MFKNGELLKRKLRRYVIPAVAVVVLAAVALVVCAAVSGEEVYIYDGEAVTTLKTSKRTVGEVLEEAEIIPGEFDAVNPSADAAITPNMEIRITRATPLFLKDGVEGREIYTLSKTVGEVLSEQGIFCRELDAVTPAPETPVTHGMEITVLRNKQIEYFGDGGTLTVNTHAYTVSGMLEGIGVTVGAQDFTEPPQDTALSDGMTVRLVRVTTKTVTDIVSIGYHIEEKSTSALTKGTTRIAQQGKNGLQTDTYTVVFHDGVEVSKEKIGSEVTREPVNKIIEKGTAAKKTTASSSSSGSSFSGGGTASTAKGENFTYRNKIVCTATAYDLSYESCGKNPGDPYYGITASGMKAGPGVIAVDPSVIPLGTRLYVEAVDGSWAYGYCVAGDTGSGIYGNCVDLFFNTRQEVRNFGKRTVNVYIL